MSNPEEKTITTKSEATGSAAPVTSATPVPPAPRAPEGGFRRDFHRRGPGGGDGQRTKNMRRSSREPRAKPEFDQKIINVRRVARVSAGGRRFSFSVAIILGNRKGSVGVGTGKGVDTAIAIEKATRNAKKNMVKISTTKTMSIAHPVESKYASARLIIMPSPGRGVVAGGAVRTIIEFAGIKDVTAKIISPSKNHLNNARAAVQALGELSTVELGTQVK